MINDYDILYECLNKNTMCTHLWSNSLYEDATPACVVSILQKYNIIKTVSRGKIVLLYLE